MVSVPGPAVVLAGAGTGKTRVIACRIAYLLASDPDLQPSNVLALTFSRRAAEEMRIRMEPLLKRSSEDLGIFTFHGFCHWFLQDHAAESGLPARFRLLDQTETWVFFRTLLPDLHLKHHWNLADPTGCIDGFLRFISRAKDELVSPADALCHAKQLAAPQARARAEEVARVYRKYQETMGKAGQLDFGDLVVRTLRILRERPTLQGRLRRQYRAILVDEFQDTNVAQIALLKLLAGPGNRLCVVGDDDQAIYRFRGASFASFLLLKEAYPHLTTFRLTQNYRSSPQILNVAERLIHHNDPDRYDPGKRLWTELPAQAPVEVLVCRDPEQEAHEAAVLIQRLWKSQPAAGRSFARIAVFYRAHSHRDRLVRLLAERKIPFSVRGGFNLFERPEIRDLMAFLQVLRNGSDSFALFRLMSHPALGIPPEELLRMSRWARDKELSMGCFLEQDPPEAALSEAARKGLALLRSDCARARVFAARDLEELVHDIAERSFLRAVFCKMPQQTVDPLKALGRFLSLIGRYRMNDPERADLSSFLWYLDSVIRAGARDLGDEEEESVEDQVQLMTVHQAKGLEFDWAILIGMAQGQFPGCNRREAIPFPVDLMKEPLPQGDYHLQEERRLCYVACTRARRGLMILTQDRSHHRPSVFVQEMLEELSPAVIRQRPAREAVVAPQNGPVSPPHAWPISERFSFTQLEAYRYCPFKYLYAYVYRIPVRSTPPMLFGIDLHDALKWFYQRILEGKAPPLPQLRDYFRRLHRPLRYGEAHEDAEYLRMGVDLLSSFYKRGKTAWAAPLFVERPFTLQLEEVSIHGVIDRVDPLPGGGVRILDYKSGKPKEKAPFDDQLQLWLYALAAQEVWGLEARQVSFYYLRNNQELSFETTPAVLERARARILAAAREIRMGRFEPTPSAARCGRCDFRNLCPASKA